MSLGANNRFRMSGETLNSLALVGSRGNMKLILFKLISRMHSLSISCKISPWWMPEYLTDVSSAIGSGNGLLYQCWPIFMTPCAVTSPQRINSIGQWLVAIQFSVYLKLNMQSAMAYAVITKCCLTKLKFHIRIQPWSSFQFYIHHLWQTFNH